MRQLVNGHRGASLCMALALLVTGCGDTGDTQSMALEFGGVVVKAEVPARITRTEARLVSFSVENRSSAELTVWIDVAVDGLAPGCAFGNARDWIDVQALADDPAGERFPVYTLGPGERSGAALDSPVSPECSGSGFDLVIVVGAPEPGGDHVSDRVTVELG